MQQSPDVLVIGGGIIGLTSAYVLSKAGLAVEVHDRGDLGREASWAGAGIIPPGNPYRAATPIDRLRAVSSAALPHFSAELDALTGIDNGYRVCGGIEYLSPDEDRLSALWAAEAVAFERLEEPAVRRLEPAVGDVPGIPYLFPGCAQVRNPWHMRALVAACGQVGVQLNPGCGVESWEMAAGRVAGVRLASGDRRTAGRYLIAAGAWTGGLLGPLGCSPAVRPVRGQIVLLRTPRPLFDRILTVGKRYLVPRGDGRVLVGSTEEPEAGFEKRTTAVAVADLIAFARSVVPGLSGADVETCWAGLRPGSPDGMPFIGPVPGHETVVLAAGHFRAGVQLSLGTAELVAAHLLGREPFVPPAAFRPDREPDLTVTPAFRS